MTDKQMMEEIFSSIGCLTAALDPLIRACALTGDKEAVRIVAERILKLAKLL